MFALILAFLELQPNLSEELSETTLALILSSLAVVISFFSILLKWFSTPLTEIRGALQEICESNSGEISNKYKIPNNLLLYAIVVMKSERPGVDLEEIHKEAPAIFEPK